MIHRLIRPALLWLAALAMPCAGWAQGHGYGTVTFASAQGYDGNLLSSARSSPVRSDTFTRLGPTVEGGYAWDLVRIGGRYSFDTDRYQRYSDLNRLFAREEAGVELRVLATRRFRVSADASYLSTETAADLNLDTLLITGRRPATRFSAMSSAIYDLTPRVVMIAGHSYTRDELVGGVGNDAHASRAGLDYRVTARNTFGVAYELRQILFTNSGVTTSGGTNVTVFGEPLAQPGRQLFHVAKARWIHAFTPNTRLELEGGPHIAEDAIRPEMSVVVRREGHRGDVSVSYAREQTTTIGEAELLDVHRIAGGGTFRPVPRVSLTAIPAVAFNRRDRRILVEKAVPVYTLDSEAAFQVASRLAIVLTGRVGRQDGALLGSDDTIFDRRFTAQIVVTVLKSPRAPGEWPRAIGEEEE